PLAPSGAPRPTASRTRRRARELGPDLEAGPGIHRVRHPRDDARRGPRRGRAPRAGHAEPPAAARAQRGRSRGDRRRPPSVREPPDFGFDPDRLARAVSTRTRAIVFNSPNNPTGKVFSRAELETIATLCREHDLLAITDEIYEHIVYDGLGHTPIATLPGMAERTVTISGISKSYSVTGWRIGYAIAPSDLSTGIRRAHDFVTVGAPHPLQEAAVPALGLPDSYYARLRAQYQARRDLLYGYIEAVGFVAWKPRGAYFILTAVAQFLQGYGCQGDTAFAMWLFENCGVAPVPGSAFSAHPEPRRTKL